MRSSWQLDAKWLAALAAIALIFAAGVSHTLYRLTEHDTATGAFTAIAVSALEDRVDSAEWERIRAEAAANPDAEYYVPGVNITVTGAEIADSTSTEALELVVGRIADTLYFQGSDAAEPLFSEEPKEGARVLGGEPGQPAEGAGVERSLDAGPFSILSQDTHGFFKPMVYGLSLIALLPLALLVLLSRRFGRLGSPGAALLIGVAPLAIVAAAADRVAGQAADSPDSLGGRLGAALTPALDDISSTFLVLAGAAAVAVVVAVLGHAGSWAFARPAVEAEPSDEALPVIAIEPPALRTEYVSHEGFSGLPSGDQRPLPTASGRRN